MWRGSGESGQATVEWVGLLLGVALMLGALVAGAGEASKGESATGLGEAVAERITCAARDACEARAALGALPGGGAVRGGGTLRGGPGRLPDRRGVRPSAPWEAPPARRSGALGGLAGLTKRAWIICLGYRRWRYDLDHRRAPNQGLPVRDAVKLANECVNPLAFFFG